MSKEKEELHNWLDQRFEEAKLSDAEIAQFTHWLKARAGENEHEHEQVSLLDVTQLFSWLKERMQCTSMKESERHEFLAWLTGRVSDSSGLKEHELKRVLNETNE